MWIDVNEKRQKVRCPTEIATKSDSNKEEPMVSFEIEKTATAA